MEGDSRVEPRLFDNFGTKNTLTSHPAVHGIQSDFQPFSCNTPTNFFHPLLIKLAIEGEGSALSLYIFDSNTCYCNPDYEHYIKSVLKLVMKIFKS